MDGSMSAGTFHGKMHRNFSGVLQEGAEPKEALMSKLPSAFMLCAALLISGCGTAEYDWNQATAAGTLPAYQSFVKNHPTDRRADDARGRILALQDDKAWAIAQAARSVAGYREYLRTESGGIYAADAQYEINALQRAAALKAVQSDARGKLSALESRTIGPPRTDA
jgi:hypothetical protein